MSQLYDKLVKRQAKLAVVGMGYVGLPLAAAFDRKLDVIGFDVNEKKIKLFQNGIDPTGEIGEEAVRNAKMNFTSCEDDLNDAVFFIVAVPTPIKADKSPDLSPIVSVSELVGRHLKKGSVVVYESTVYPGVTEEICAPVLEKNSGLVCGLDFKIGYSPERINPGDKVHRVENITKIVSGMDEETLDCISKVYDLVIEAGTYKASGIKVAEAAKVVENSQRDINIAFMNEISMVFDKMGIDTQEVMAAMNTKWNALRFNPGLVGGHCIGVDPYYFIYEAERLGYHSQIILSGRKINDGMGEFVADRVIKELILSNKLVRQSKVAVFGMTFKENCPDIRNSKVLDVINRLKEFGVDPMVTDCYACSEDVFKEYGIALVSEDEICNLDCLVLAVSHDVYRRYSAEKLSKFFKPGVPKLLIDIKAIYDKNVFEQNGFRIWRL